METKNDENSETSNARLRQTSISFLIRECISQWALNSKGHGIANIARSKSRLLRLIWLLAFLASLGYCFYQISLTLIYYQRHQVITKYSLINEAPAIYPAVSICNLNPFDGYLAQDPIDDLLNERNFSINNYKLVIDYLDSVTNQFKSTFQARAANETFNLYLNGFYLSQMLLSCKFQGQPCSQQDFSYFYDYNYGNCYRFNGGGTDESNNNQPVRLKKTKTSGWMNGLRLEMYTGDRVLQQQFTFKTGIRVIVHNQSVQPFPLEDGIDVSTGEQTNIAVSRTFIEHLGEPYNDCIDKLDQSAQQRNSLVESLQSDFNLTYYDQKYCLKVCLQQFIIEKCACFDYSLPMSTQLMDQLKMTGCYTTENVICTQKNQKLFYNSDEIDKCNEKCPMSCHMVDYSLRVTQAKYPSKWYLNKLLANQATYDLFNKFVQTNFTAQNIESTLLMINVFYDEMIYLKIEEEPQMDIDLLIALIGGNLGLFLGTSLLTIAEIFELTFNIIYFGCFGTKRTSVVRPA
jgi:hypothetical protein